MGFAGGLTWTLLQAADIVTAVESLGHLEIVAINVGVLMFGGLLVLGLFGDWGHTAIDKVGEGTFVTLVAGFLGLVVASMFALVFAALSTVGVFILVIGIPMGLVLLFAQFRTGVTSDSLYPTRGALIFLGVVVTTGTGLPVAVIVVTVVVLFRAVGLVALGSVVLGKFGVDSRWLGLLLGVAVDAVVLYVVPILALVVGLAVALVGTGAGFRAGIGGAEDKLPYA
jgi:hypothetical protein